MTDPKLDKEIEHLKGCMESLRHFHSVFDNAILTETVVPEDEGKLQELRLTLPTQWDTLVQRLGLRADNSVSTIAELANSLATVVTLTDFQKRKLYDVWHRAQMKLHFLLGRLLDRRQKLEALHPGREKARKVVTGVVFLVALAVIAIVIFVILR